MQSRRRFIKNSGIATLGFLGLQQWAYGLHAETPAADVGYGPLLQDPKGIIDLPKGFSYKIISKQGDKMSDGLFVPGRPDGMGTFAGAAGKVIVIRNHENDPDKLKYGAFGNQNELLPNVDITKFYDAGKKKYPSLGGTTTFIYNPKTQQVEQSFLSLAGTSRNCAGGPTPWKSWLTCEETTEKIGGYDGYAERDHGFVFDVPATEKIQLAAPTPIKAMGRFNHEAVAVDPKTGIVYLTEDMGDGAIYRFIPTSPGNLLQGGRLQALAIIGQKSCDTRNWKSNTTSFPIGKTFQTSWVDLEDVESPNDDLRYQAYEKGAARFARGEGMWFGNNEVYFACTNGGKEMNGQIFRYRPGLNEGDGSKGGALDLFIETPDKDALQNCDNLTVAPWGDVFFCEDHHHARLIGVTPSGQLYKFGENVGYKSEFAGGVFSPDGSVYFVNIQDPGLTIAITGPWKR
ncbi:alkaline phosphatase PhoX [Pseudochryseolinea flava]|uniref:Phosphatase n=1 Tax=Pseudochryseolinea flava TaxID=2059302 RepID=A0A364Y0K8_9BACT|nr:alkaline phosphatase PhoX [Pseudochryseolinea flava]RAW00324.1 phosphatase [Pseudochryseolinea flava]